jgi:CPA1 family monovalent cation:H+ antiporter
LELQSAVRGLTSVGLARGLLEVVVVSVVLFAVRLAFLFVTAYLIRALDRRPSQRLRRVSHRSRVVSATAGFRGAVSLAAALAVPAVLSSGAPFPGRDTIVFVTAGVIAVTVVVQGLLLPKVVRWARLPEDRRVEAERHLAQVLSAEEALAALPRVSDQLGTDAEVVLRTEREYDEHLRVLKVSGAAAEDEPLVRHDQQYAALRLALLAHKRSTVIRLRDTGRIDDTVLRQMQSRLDLEEVRLSQRELVE